MGICEPPFDLSGQREGTLTSAVSGTNRPISLTLENVKSGFPSGSIASLPCWPFRDDVTGGANREECHSDNVIHISSGLFPANDGNFFTLTWEPTNTQTFTGSYEMFAKVSGCPTFDRGTVTMNRVE